MTLAEEIAALKRIADFRSYPEESTEKFFYVTQKRHYVDQKLMLYETLVLSIIRPTPPDWHIYRLAKLPESKIISVDEYRTRISGCWLVIEHIQ